MKQFTNMERGNKRGIHLHNCYIPYWKIQRYYQGQKDKEFIKKSKPVIHDIRIIDMQKYKASVLLFNLVYA